MKKTLINVCPVCKIEAQDVSVKEASRNGLQYKCARCGKFKISKSLQPLIGKKNPGSKLSGWIRNLSELGMEIPDINMNILKEIERSIPEYNPSDKQYLFLRHISNKSKYPGDIISIHPQFDYPLAWASAPDELFFYIRFLFERGLLISSGDTKDILAGGNKPVAVTISPYGWEYLDKYEQRAIELSQAYVAMSFSNSMNTAWEKAIKPAINDAGYKACRVKSNQHTDKINAKIIAEIKNSMFVVADVTQQQRVVYFEAGYAIGRNLPVIWCVRKDDLKNVHFDTRQYNHVVWETTDELKEKLYDVICAVVGRRKKI